MKEGKGNINDDGQRLDFCGEQSNVEMMCCITVHLKPV